MAIPIVVAGIGAAVAALQEAAIATTTIILTGVAANEVYRAKKEIDAARAARDAARKKAAEDFATVGPFADALSKAMELAQEEDCSRRKECPALKGYAGPVNHHMSSRSAAYQSRITGFPPHVEWIFDGKDFDGFFPDICRLVETKANYSFSFLNDPYIFRFPSFSGVDRALKQALRQYSTILRNPPTSLAWYFQTEYFYLRMTDEFRRAGLAILTIHQP